MGDSKMGGNKESGGTGKTVSRCFGASWSSVAHTRLHRGICQLKSGNQRGKERPRVGQSLVRRGSHLILLQGKTIRMLKGRKEKERRESLERKGRDAIKCRGRTILDGGFGPQPSGSVLLLTLWGA